MFGYIRPASDRLSGEENERFRAMYCGLCRTMGKRYGQSARFLLNFDFTFLAILLSSAEEPVCRKCVCIAHPCKRHCAAQATPALELAADRSVILAWWQLQDHIADRSFFSSLKYRLAALFLRRAYCKACGFAQEFDESVQRHLNDLSRREEECCASIDAAAEPFAALMADVALCVEDTAKSRILREIFYHLGRWIYLIDAADDFTEDAKSGCYNPLRYRYNNFSDKLDDPTKAALSATLDASIKQMASAYALCDYGIWTPILDSIFYDSFYGIGKAVLSGAYHKPSRKSPAKQEKHEETV